MDPNEYDDRQVGDGTPSKTHAWNHRKIIEDTLVVIQKQEDIMKQLSQDLEFFRKNCKDSLDYDIGNGNYLADVGDETIDLRSYQKDLGNGEITAETATEYLGYKSAMDNFQMGFKRTKEEVEKVWKDVDLVKDGDEWFQKDSLKISSKWEVDALDRGRKAAAQE